MDLLMQDLGEEISEMDELGAISKRKKTSLNQIVTNGYTLNPTANTVLKTTIVNPLAGNQDGSFRSILAGISLVNTVSSQNDTAASLGTLVVNNNKVLDSISCLLLDPVYPKSGFFFPIMYEISQNSQISFELLTGAANVWRLDIVFRPKNFK